MTTTRPVWGAMLYAPILLLLLFTFLAPKAAFSHGEEKHTKEGGVSVKLEKVPESGLLTLQQDYEKTAGPILERKCADCHGRQTKFPWYYSLPGVKQLIDSDIAKAKEHFDFSKGFPFAGHGSIADDLKALDKTATENSMPPLSYRAMHWDSGLTPPERAMIQVWSQRALATLKVAPTSKISSTGTPKLRQQPDKRPNQGS